MFAIKCQLVPLSVATKETKKAAWGFKASDLYKRGQSTRQPAPGPSSTPMMDRVRFR